MNVQGLERRSSISLNRPRLFVIRLEYVFCCKKKSCYFLAVFLSFISSFIVCPIGICSARPIFMDQYKRSQTTKRDHGQYAESAAYDDELQSYLTDFGYLPKNNPEISNLRSDVAVKMAIGRLQEYAGLSVTSTLDEPTRNLLRQKRCGMADIQYDSDRSDAIRRKRYTLFGDKWRKLRLTYKVVNYTPHMDEGQTRLAVHDAFKLWSDASALEFVETSDDGADILIEFARGSHGDGYPFDGKNIVLAHAFFPGSGRGGDAHFDADETWTDKPSSLYDYERVNFYTVAAHEFGHSLGLGHSKDRNALMFAYYRNYADLTKLPYDDTLAIQKAYGIGKYGVPEMPSTTESSVLETDAPSLATYAPPASFTTAFPDICQSRIDAVANIRQEIFVFKGRYFWRYNDDGVIMSEPIEINRFWHGFPDDFDGVDAVFERPNVDTIVFFKGTFYWEFVGNHALPGYPKSIKNLGLPDDVKVIDAAFVWDWSRKAYIFSGDKYWRLNDDMTVDHDYPRYMAKFWIGVPSNIDAAFTDKTGATYFFKDSNVYKFNNVFSRVDKHYPIPVTEFWKQCHMKSKEYQMSYSKKDSSSCESCSTNIWIMLFTVMVLFIYKTLL